jgi:hypothetical protein
MSLLGVLAALSGCFDECRSTSGTLPTPYFPANRFGNGASRNNDGWYVGGGFDYMVHKGPM